jgi:hypothetical protein
MLQFSPETIQHLRTVLDDASAELQADSSTKALMAEHPTYCSNRRSWL